MDTISPFSCNDRCSAQVTLILNSLNDSTIQGKEEPLTAHPYPSWQLGFPNYKVRVMRKEFKRKTSYAAENERCRSSVIPVVSKANPVLATLWITLDSILVQGRYYVHKATSGLKQPQGRYN